MSIITVGSSGTFKTIASAVAAARDGDVLKVQAGTYTNDFATISKKLTIEGVGGMAHLHATKAPPDGKAILTVNTDLTIRNLEFSGAKVADGNGAGIRYQGGKLTVEDSSFHDNQNGILGNSVAGGTITIRDSEFDHNGAGDGRTHNLYVNTIAKLTVEDSWFHDAVVGHQIKSRALETVVTGSRITDDGGNGSYSIDLPNGGKAVISDNVIEQGARSGNPAMIHFGGEGTPRAGSSLTITGNTVVNEMNSPSATLLLNQTSVVATIRDQEVFGLKATEIAKGPASVLGTELLPSRPRSDASSPINDADDRDDDDADDDDRDDDGAGGNDGDDDDGGVTVPNPLPGDDGGKLVLHVSEDAWNGHAQYMIEVDDRPVGGVRTASASHAAGRSEAVVVGDLPPGEHDVTITFLNDAWAGTKWQDRNLYLDGITYDGTYEAIGKAMMSRGGFTVAVGEANAPAAGPDGLALSVSVTAPDVDPWS